MTIKEFFEKTKGKKIRWHRWYKHHYFIPQSLEGNKIKGITNNELETFYYFEEQTLIYWKTSDVKSHLPEFL